MTFEGGITEIDLLPKLVELSDQRFTGAIRFENDTIIKIVYFKEGEVLSASTNDRADSIDEILLRANKVSREHVKQALARRKENETLGDAMLSLGFITRKELTWARRAQVVGILRSLSGWTEGSYTIVNDYLPKREEGTSFHLPQLIVELLVTEEDRGAIEQAVRGGDAVYEVVFGGDEKYRRLGLNEDADAILAHIDGSRTAAELASGSAMDTFSVYKLLHALHVLGITRLVDAPAASVIAPPPALELNESLEVPYEEPAASAADWSDPAPAAESWQPPQVDLSYDSYDAYDADTPLNFDDPVDAPSPQAAAATDTPRELFTPASPVIAPATTVPDSTTSPYLRSKAPALGATSKRSRNSKLPLVAALVVLLLGASGYAAWRFLAGGDDVATPAVQPSKAAKRSPAAPATDAQPVAVEPAPTPLPPSSASVTTAEPAASAPVETPAPVAPQTASADPQRARYEQMAREYAAESASAPYSVQIAFVCETSSLTTAVESGGADVWFVPAERGGRTCFRVLWGRHSDRRSASRAISSVPSRYRQGRPVVVELSQVISR